MPAYLRMCAPWLGPMTSGCCSAGTHRRGRCPTCRCWTPRGSGSATRRRASGSVSREAAVAAATESMTQVVEHLIESDDSEMAGHVDAPRRGPARRPDRRGRSPPALGDPDLLAGPFAHIVVDEAQELTDAEWQMLLSRCPSRSFTIVGDRAQARHGFTETWRERLERIGLERIDLASLSINYRTPGKSWRKRNR